MPYIYGCTQFPYVPLYVPLYGCIIFKYLKQLTDTRSMHNRRDLMNESNEFEERYLMINDEVNEVGLTRGGSTNLRREQIFYQIQQINTKLEPMFRQKVGDLTSNQPKEIEKTLQVIQSLISQVLKQQQVRRGMANELRQLNNLEAQNIQAKEKFQQQKKNLENDKEGLHHRIKVLESTMRETNSKMNSEKQELAKQVKQLQQREKGFEAEFKKKDLAIKAFQDGMKKFQQRPQFKNSFDIIQKFDNGPGIYTSNGDHEYSRLAVSSIDETFRKLQTENQNLKDCLINIYKELNSVLELKKETLRNKRGYDGEYENFFELNCFRPETLNLPQQWSQERLKDLNENIAKFKQAIKIGDLSQGKVEQRKNSCIGGIKQLITNYKQVVETQDQLLNKVLLKSKEFKASQMSQIQNKYSKLIDENEIERAKKFVQDQGRYLEQKNADLQKTRRMMQMAMKKAEQNKREMLKQRQDFQNQAMEMRRSIEVLPARVEEELRKKDH